MYSIAHIRLPYKIGQFLRLEGGSSNKPLQVIYRLAGYIDLFSII